MNIQYNLQKLSNNIKKVPTERLLFKFGVNKTTKGDFYLTQESAQRIIDSAKEYGNKLNIDYNHSQLDPGITPDSGASAGTFDLTIKEDGLYATNIEWTDRAANYILSKEYIYTSPAFITEIQNDQETIIEVINFALTNIPATLNMDQLMAASKFFNKKDTDMTTENIENTAENVEKVELAAEPEETVEELGCGGDKKKRTSEDLENPEICAEMPMEDSPMSDPMNEPTIDDLKSVIDELKSKLAEKEALVLELESKIAEMKGESESKDEELNTLSKNVKDLTNKLEYNEKESIVLSAISTGKILPAQKNLYMKLSTVELSDELSKLPTKNPVLTKTHEAIIESDEQSESKKLAAYAIKRILG